MKASVQCTRRQYVCGNERLKLIGNIDGFFSDFGHHLENEMGGLWLYPVKLLDGFWLRFTDHTAKTVDCWTHADKFENYPYKNVFEYGGGLGHTTVKIKRTQIIPDEANGLIVSYEFYNSGNEACRCSTEFIARTDIRPVWLSEDAGVYDGEADEVIESRGNIFVVKDSANPWYAVIGCDTKAAEVKTGQFFGPENTVGNGVSVGINHEFILNPRECRIIKFFVSGSDISQEDACREYEKLQNDRNFEENKKQRYEKLYAKSALSTGDARFDEIFKWVKAHTDWLITATSNGSRGIAAGIPEYPWWFGCDSFYTLQGVLCMGDYKLCRDTLKLILDYSAKYNGDGRIVHEILTNEVCPNYGNTQETAHFITMVWKYYEWTGDFSLVEEAFEYMGKSILWLKKQDDDGDLFPTGYGIIEIAGLNMELIDTAVYTYEAYDCYAKMCRIMAERQNEGQLIIEADVCEKLAQKTKTAINTLFWNEEEGLYCDAYTSFNVVSQKKEMILAMLGQSESEHIKQYVERLLKEREMDQNQERGWLLNRNWVINIPMEVGMAPVEQAKRALLNMHTDEFIGPCGMYLDAMTKKAAMTISTGAMAVAQVQYGYADRALELIEKIFSTFGMATPGSISEMSPDYGCFVQAWTTYGVMTPIVRHFFGIQPSASENKIVLKPSLPSKWHDASVKQVAVLDGEMDIDCRRTDRGVEMTVCNRTGRPVEFIYPKQWPKDTLVCGEIHEEKKFTVIF